jgi:hypothetical protein
MTPQEKLRDKLRLMTKTIGLVQMMKSIGLSDLLKKTEGFDFLTEVELRKSIQECVDIAGGPLQYNELGIQPILWRETQDEIHQIEFFSDKRVKVQVWGGYNYDTDEGGYYLPYERLDKDQLMLIVYGFLDFIESEMIL